MNHELMIAKLAAHGFGYKALQLIYSYLNNRYQRVKVNANYSSWVEILSGVPQGSILGPLLFNIYLSDMFLFFDESYIANYADDSTPYTIGKDIASVMKKLESDSIELINWIKINHMRANPDKFHLLLSSANNDLYVNVDTHKIYNMNSKKLLGITIDRKLSMNEHVSKLCKNASKKLHALARISKYMNIYRKRIIMKTFINSQFGDCPLVWMLHSRSLNNKINKIQERALRLVYNDNRSTFEELLIKDDSVTIHDRNIQALSIELFKVINGISPNIMKEVFIKKSCDMYSSKFPFTTRAQNLVISS